MQRISWRFGGLIVVVMLAAVVLLSATLIQPGIVSAQFAEPTATPTDPIWLAFSAARDLIEEEENVDLTVVQRWDFFQDDWSKPNASHPEQAAGIDSCNSTIGIAAARPVYFGWTFQIRSLRGDLYEARVSFDLNDTVICDIQTTTAAAAATPAPGAEVDPNLPPPLVGSGATGSFELGGHVDGLSQQAISAMRQSGMTWVKKQLRTSAGVNVGYDMINDAKANGFKILLGVVGDKAALGANPDAYAEEYAVFVRALAEAGADAIEVWNEPNIDREWPTGQVNGANYTRLLAVAYNAIKSVNPNTIVISGAPAPTGFFGAAGCADAGCNDDVFMQQMASAGAGQYMDCLGLHYNEGIVGPNINSGDPRGEYPTYYFGSMTNRGASLFPGKPVCYTELGYLSGQDQASPIPPAFAWASNVTVAEHANWLAQAASIAATRGDVRIMIIWNVNFTRFDSDPMGGYAIIRPDGTCPACGLLGQVMGAGGS